MKSKEIIILFANIVTRFFTTLALVFACLSAVTSIIPEHDALEFTATHVLKIFIVACVFGLITVVRVGLENKKWMLRLTLIQKRWIFFPLYLAALLLFINNYGMLSSFGFLEIAICSISFFVVAGVITVLADKKYKDEKRNLTNSVIEYKSKIGG